MIQLEFYKQLPLHSALATRQLEHSSVSEMPAHALMQRAGLALARLALALTPHAKSIWLACGPGNNGGDGMEAAFHLQQWGKQPVVTWLGQPASVPPAAAQSYARAQQAGVCFSEFPPEQFDLCIDALFGLGPASKPEGRAAQCLQQIRSSTAPVLAVDLPSGLDADTGTAPEWAVRAQHTLSLLTLKPGLFTAQGRDHVGTIWFDALGTAPSQALANATASLSGKPNTRPRLHQSHKGSYGDVAVIGGASGMVGAPLLAASAALYGGAGRVFVGLLDGPMSITSVQPELMFRSIDSLDLASMTVVCGCGGGTQIHGFLARILSTSAQLVLDADGLNAVARDTQLQSLLRSRSARQRTTILTPHPLEAARLLDCSTIQVQADRLGTAQQLAERFNCVAVLKGSGTVVAAPGQRPAINPTGTAKLATAGTGDVLAGMVAARLAAGQSALEAACDAVYQHGWVTDHWPTHQPLSASLLARSLSD